MQARGGTLRFDVVAGVTAAAVVLPKAMAYATVAGLPVAVGLYTAFVPMAIYAFLGSSRVLSVSSSATLGILTGSELAIVVPDGDAAKLATACATLVALVGLMLLLARLLRLGFVANFISAPVLTGFKAGIALTIILDQAPKLIGVHIEKHGFFRDLWSIVQDIPHTQTTTLIVAAATFALLLGMDRLWPHSPAPLVAVGGTIAAVWFFGLAAQGVATKKKKKKKKNSSDPSACSTTPARRSNVTRRGRSRSESDATPSPVPAPRWFRSRDSRHSRKHLRPWPRSSALRRPRGAW